MGRIKSISSPLKSVGFFSGLHFTFLGKKPCLPSRHISLLMALSTFVKINTVTNLTEARYGAGMYVDLLGFNLDPNSENHVSPEQFKEISGWVSGVGFVAEFSTGFDSDVLAAVAEYPGITWIEHDRIEVLEDLADKGFSLIYKVTLEEVSHIEPQISATLSRSGIIAHLVSSEDHNSQEDLEVIRKLSENCRVILGTEIDPDQLLGIIESTGIYGISISGSQEIKPGLRDLDQMAEILERLEVED